MNEPRIPFGIKIKTNGKISRKEERGFRREFDKVSKDFAMVEHNFFVCLFHETDGPFEIVQGYWGFTYRDIYFVHERLWRMFVDTHNRDSKLKYVALDRDYFTNKYRPIEGVSQYDRAI